MRKFTLPLLVIFLFSTSSLLAQTPTLSSEALFPPNPEPGKCYQRCVIPGEIDYVIEKFEKDVRTDVKIVDPQPRTETIPYENKGGIGYEVTPTNWSEDTTIVTVSEPGVRYIPTEATFRTEKRIEIIEPEKTVYDCTDPIYRDVTKRVMIKDSSFRIVTVPAVYKTVIDSVLVEEEHTEIRVIPGEFAFRDSTYLRRDSFSRYREKEASYTQVTIERFLTKPAVNKWVQKRDETGCTSPNPDDCLTWCYVEEPAVYDVITKKEYITDNDKDSRLVGDKIIKKEFVPQEFGTFKVRYMLKPATTDTIYRPARYRRISKRVVDKPATTREEWTDAVYTTITTKELVKEGECIPRIIPPVTREISVQVVSNSASYTTQPIPPQTETVSVRKVNRGASVKQITIPAEPGGTLTVTRWTEPSYEFTTVRDSFESKRAITKKVSDLTEWREVVCKPTNTSGNLETIGQGGYPRNLMVAVQNALMARGYALPQFGADGNFGQETRDALNQYQRGAGIGVGALTIESLRSLNIPKDLWTF